MSSKTYIVRTLGCKANFYDSQLIEAELQRRGWTPKSAAEASDSTLCIVNSCTVTDEADRQSRRLAARLSRENPGAFVVVTGCAAEVDPERLARSKGIHYVIGNRDKPRLIDVILEKLDEGLSGSVPPPARGEVLGQAQGYDEMLSRHPMDREWPGGEDAFLIPPTFLATSLERQGAKTRAFLKIQEGCNSFCTYCVIPYGRGPSRSLRPREVLTRVRELVKRGVREVVITGTNIGDYGTDWADAPQHAELFALILSETDLERLRVSSLDPTEITPTVLELAAGNPRFCPHFHVSLQSPHDRILRLMKRRYGYAEVRRCLEAIAAIPGATGGAFVGMDVITGFPGETDEDFNWGLDALAELPWTRLHVFPYSERARTPATRLPGAVRPDERARRARKLAELSLARMTAHYQKALEACRANRHPLDGILLERAGKPPVGALPAALGAVRAWVAGYTSNYLRVYLPYSVQLQRNQLISTHPLALSIDSAGGEVSFIAEYGQSI